MDKQEGFHSVDEQVISPLHSSLIQPEDSVSQTGSNSSRRRKDAQIKAATASLQAKQQIKALKNLQFHAANNDITNLGISQLQVATASELNVLPFSTSAKLPNRDLLQPGIKCSFKLQPLSA